MSDFDLVIDISGKRGKGATFFSLYIGRWRRNAGDKVTYIGPTPRDTERIQRQIDAMPVDDININEGLSICINDRGAQADGN